MLAEPAETPVTMPEIPTVATLPSLLDHVPPVLAVASVVELPSHTVAVPVMLAGTG